MEPQTADEWRSIVRAARAARQWQCQFGCGRLGTDLSHISKRKGYSVDKVASRSDINNSAKKALMLNALSRTYLLCAKCHRDYDRVRGQFRQPQYNLSITLQGENGVCLAAELPVP